MTLKEKMLQEGYYELREIPGHGLCGLRNFIFTIGLCCNLDETGYSYRYCYRKEDALDAIVAITIWDGQDDPPGRIVAKK